MEGSLYRETVEKSLQKINVLGNGSVILVAGYWNLHHVLQGGSYAR